MKMNNIFRVLFLFFLILFVVFLGLIFNIKSTTKHTLVFKVLHNEFELGYSFNIQDYISTNADIVKISEIDYQYLGKQKITVSLLYNYETFEKSVEIEIKDTIPPKIKLKKTSIDKNELIQLENYYEIIEKDKYYSFTKIIEKDRIVLQVKDRSNHFTDVSIKIDKPNYILKRKKAVDVPSVPKTIERSQKNQSTSSKQFLFKDGLNFNTAYEKCINFLKTVQVGMCVPLKNKNHYIGYQYHR